ncbi:hypothetical protein HH214_03240 [Mucilaginibacter robiniae]|uniref:DUF5640 domain-containing protein n=1 Tax=Mucilaginibacter robiniae TaxID=2728022 RepID=A0A7L5E2D4_9SPHI|nr:hypothetical protein [Mucilaginibacter robiniae]QJD94963.1 hypothetical protein HH214_03240 [Mucilaginibacter robiniae]
MKNFALVFVHIVCALILISAACSKSPHRNFKGNWHTQDGHAQLKITDKDFFLVNDSPAPEDYFMKGDTVYTSFEGNQPYTRYVIQKLDDHHLTLLFPDSVPVSFVR